MSKDFETNRLRALDVLRGIAVLMVVVFHFSMPAIREQPSFFTRFGITGVNLFFIISGFVIFMSLERVNSAKEFLINRIVRLYPTYWWCASLLMLLYSYQFYHSTNRLPDSELWVRYLANMTMFQHYLQKEHLDAPFWSLIIEVLFYVTVLVIYKAGKAAYTEEILLVPVCCWGLVEIVTLYHPYNAILKKVSNLDFYYPIINYLPLFLLGIVFYKILKESFTLRRGVIIVICYSMQLFSYHRQGALAVFNVTRFDYAMILLVFICVMALSINGTLKKLSISPLLFFGRISYALYLFHQYFCLTFLMPLLEEKMHLSNRISIPVSFCIAVGVAWLNTVLIDEPMRKRLKKILMRRSSNMVETGMEKVGSVSS